MRIKNPFVIGTYVSPEYFCGREEETKLLRKHIDNGRNVVLTAPRRLGKTGLIHHFLNMDAVRGEYYCFFIDLYSTGSLAEMVQILATEIFGQLKTTRERWWERFATVLSSLSMGLSIDPMTGEPTFSIGLGQIHSPETSLEQIFQYLETADKPCIVAIDEFQQIAHYEEKNVEALLRTKIQRCVNIHFIYCGSKQHMMNQMFVSPSRPFYESSISMSLSPLPLDVYTDFCLSMFERWGKHLQREVVERLYADYDGYTWYMHMMMNELFTLTDKGEVCTLDLYDEALENIVISQSHKYKELLSMVPSRQKGLLEAIARDGKVRGVTSSAFIRKHSLPSASSVQSAIKGLLEKELVSRNEDVYYVYDRFFAHYLLERHRL